MRGADLLAEMLIAYGVDVVFGVPGDTNMPFYDALRRRSDSIRHVMARDERSAGFMADAYARLSNKPGVFEAPSGAGPMYSLPAVAEAHFSAVPVILITSDTPLALEGRGVISAFDVARLFESITKESYLVKAARQIPEVVRRAFRIATGGRPGAVQLVIPEDILNAEVDTADVSLHAESPCRRFPSYPSGAPTAQIGELLRLIHAAKRPLFVAGGGVNRSGAGDRLRAVAERLQVPVVATITGQCALADDHPLAIGIAGDNGFHPHANRAVEDADCLVYLGCKLGSVITAGWTLPKARADRTIIQVDIDAAVLGNAAVNTLSICGDVGVVLGQVLEQAPAQPDRDGAWVALLATWRDEFWMHARAELDDERLPLKPARVVGAFNARLRGPCNILSDAGTPTPYMTRYLRSGPSRSRFIAPRAFGGLGYAIPAVVGAWCANPGVRPVALFGDGSFGMSVGELETLVRLEVPALLLHFNNACFGLIKALQKLYGHNTAYSVDFTAADAARIAEAFGLKAWRATTPTELDRALDQAFAHDGPAFVDIVVESIAEIAPPMFSWLSRMGHDPFAVPPPRDVRVGQFAQAGH